MGIIMYWIIFVTVVTLMICVIDPLLVLLSWLVGRM